MVEFRDPILGRVPFLVLVLRFLVISVFIVVGVLDRTKDDLPWGDRHGSQPNVADDVIEFYGYLVFHGAGGDFLPVLVRNSLADLVGS